MATDLKSTGTGLAPYRLSVRQFETMIGAGVFPEGAHVELLAGVLVDNMTKKPPHDFAVGRLGDLLRGLLPPEFCLREEKSLIHGRWWRPEPDIAVVRGRWEDFRVRSPRLADVALLVEIADTSYAKDRGIKWRRYASARVPLYWIVNLSSRRLEVYEHPDGRGQTAAYRDAATYGPDDEVPLVLDGREVGRISVRDLLP
jgi:Uma2 family endonuclease